jgi:hypothetical protein
MTVIVVECFVVVCDTTVKLAATRQPAITVLADQNDGDPRRRV